MSDATAVVYQSNCWPFFNPNCMFSIHNVILTKTVHLIATKGHTVGTCYGVISHAVCVVPP